MKIILKNNINPTDLTIYNFNKLKYYGQTEFN